MHTHTCRGQGFESMVTANAKAASGIGRGCFGVRGQDLGRGGERMGGRSNACRISYIDNRRMTQKGRIKLQKKFRLREFADKFFFFFAMSNDIHANVFVCVCVITKSCFRHGGSQVTLLHRTEKECSAVACSCHKSITQFTKFRKHIS